MKCGETVKIYEDPLTETKLEGEATLVLKVAEDAESETWRVIFDNHNMCARRIKKR